MRKLSRWTLWTFLILCLAAMLWLAPLAYPYPLFSYSERVGSNTFYSDSPIDAQMQEVVSEVGRRLRAVEIYDRQAELDVFLCRSAGLYRFFARLTLVPTHVPGFNISQAHNSFMSLPGIEERYQRTGGFPKYSAIGSDLAHTITHELVHNYAVMKIGFFAAQEVPRWKSEGYAEYAASLAAREIDSNATLRQRIEIMKHGLHDDRAREYYSWSLVTEYLSDIQGLGFDELMTTSLTYDQAYAQMMAWCEETAADI